MHPGGHGAGARALDLAGPRREREHRTHDRGAKGRKAATEVNQLSGEMGRTFFGDLAEADAATVVTLLRKAL